LKYNRAVYHCMKRQLNANDVYDILAHIPEGRITTYGDIAKALGRPGASRAVGRILNKNPNPIVVPCHRVVMSNGSVGGYAFGAARKKALLAKEGLRFSGNSMDDFAKCRVALDQLVPSDG
jgi:methylated-DNA-[protein]-cysteine S-methyltransferase